MTSESQRGYWDLLSCLFNGEHIYLKRYSTTMQTDSLIKLGKGGVCIQRFRHESLSYINDGFEMSTEYNVFGLGS